ncbi:MAG: hypothetical protein ACK4ND_06435, partial [Cytophagaceae bacterium]
MKKIKLILLIAPFIFFSNLAFGQDDQDDEIDVEGLEMIKDSLSKALESAFSDMFSADIIFDLPDKDFVKTGNTYLNDKKS